MNTMNTDTYRKAILTVIAVCLLCLVLRSTPPLTSTANAANNALDGTVKISLLSQTQLAQAIASAIAAENIKVKIVDASKKIEVNIVEIDGKGFGLGQIPQFKPVLPVEIVK